MATGQPRGLILIRRNFSCNVEMVALQIVTTKDLNPEHPVSQNCFSILQQSLAICGLK